MRYLLILALGTLAACSSAGAREEEKYDMVDKQTKSDPEKVRDRQLCAQGKAVAAAYLDERNEPKYKDWKLKSDIYCLSASL
jgi:hypothetical protein